MPGDNFHFDISSDSRSHFDMMIEIGFTGAPGGKAYSYKICPDKGIVLSWLGKKDDKYSSDRKLEKDYILLPYPLDKDNAKQFLWDLLKAADLDWGRPMSHDGDSGKGFRIYNEAWGRISPDQYSFLAVQPSWQLYGK